MAADHKRHNFSQACDREALLLLVELELLERDDVTGFNLLSSEDNAIGSFFNMIQSLVRIDRATR